MEEKLRIFYGDRVKQRCKSKMKSDACFRIEKSRSASQASEESCVCFNTFQVRRQHGRQKALLHPRPLPQNDTGMLCLKNKQATQQTDCAVLRSLQAVQKLDNVLSSIVTKRTAVPIRPPPLRVAAVSPPPLPVVASPGPACPVQTAA